MRNSLQWLGSLLDRVGLKEAVEEASDWVRYYAQGKPPASEPQPTRVSRPMHSEPPRASVHEVMASMRNAMPERQVDGTVVEIPFEGRMELVPSALRKRAPKAKKAPAKKAAAKKAPAKKAAAKKAPAKKAAAKKAPARKSAAQPASEDAVGMLEAALRGHARQKDLVSAGKEKDQLLRSLIPLYLAKSLDVEVTSGTTSRFWSGLGVTYAAPNAAKALRLHAGYAQDTKKGKAITAKGVRYVEDALSGQG
ncbi:hypothetical protein OV207_13165 [Corallococcus sp. BB11-1]|uniref:hypothetical protein n=1 Tax=Corallococcus sp. BB11-1 TaxID=2996783 RepID=UPI00226F641A|nr:hypothetical protein [Corallococcus sp. BB11-1]MCY1032415.1 hypothetical protein [Corallococcus sp. BB11-1]